MEELNKTQLVLLMLFISFVTSIATGIVTVTLLEQAPKSVTQQINRIVERTVEKVVPGPAETRTINTTTQVVVSEDDLIIRAVAKTTPALVRIRVPGASSAVATTTVHNLASVAAADNTPVSTQADVLLTGIAVSENGRVIASPTGLFSASDVGKEYVVLTQGTDAERKALLIYYNEGEDLIVLDIISSETDGKFGYATFPVKPLALGQTLVLINFTNGISPTVEVGRVIDYRHGSASSTPTVATNITTTSIILGDPLIDTNGSFAGFLRRGGKVTPFDGIKTALNKGFYAPVDKETKAQ